MSALPFQVAEVLLRAPGFEVGLRPRPAGVAVSLIRELEERGLVETEVRWRRTVEGERVAREVAERKRRSA